MSLWRRCAALSAVALLLAAAGCLGRGNEAEDQKALLDNVKAWEEASNAGDVDRLLGLLTPHARVLPPNHASVEGDEALRAFFQEMADAGVTLELQNEDVAGDRNLAYTAGRYAVKGPDGTEIDHGKYLEVWRRIEGAWKLHRLMWNSSVEVPEPAAAGEEGGA